MERRGMFSAIFMGILEEMNNFAMVGAEMMEEDDNEEEDLVALQMTTQVHEEPHRIEGYVEKTVAGYTEKVFQSHFRLTLRTYEELERTLGATLATENPSIAVSKQLLSVIWLLATPDSFRSVGDRFNMAKSSLHHSFVSVVNALNAIAKGIIKWPSVQEKIEAKEAFARFAGLQGCIGAVDGTFVEIEAPDEHPHVYITRKNFYAMQLQAIALPNLKFTDIYTGYPGSVGDRRVFTNSNIYKNIERNPEEYFAPGEYILGDKAYPILPWCICPYIDRGNLSASQIHFNSSHAKTRQVIERAFALLFGRSRRLKFLDMNRTDLIPTTILACCVMHNLCLLDDDSDTINEMIAEGEAFLNAQRERMGPVEDNLEICPHPLACDGHSARLSLMRTLF